MFPRSLTLRRGSIVYVVVLFWLYREVRFKPLRKIPEIGCIIGILIGRHRQFLRTVNCLHLDSCGYSYDNIIETWKFKVR